MDKQKRTARFRRWAQSEKGKAYYARPDVKERRCETYRRSAKKNRQNRYAHTRKWNATERGREYRKQYGKAWRTANLEKVREYQRRQNEKRKAKRAAAKLVSVTDKCYRNGYGQAGTSGGISRENAAANLRELRK